MRTFVTPGIMVRLLIGRRLARLRLGIRIMVKTSRSTLLRQCSRIRFCNFQANLLLAYDGVRALRLRYMALSRQQACDSRANA